MKETLTNFTERDSTPTDFEFLYTLKKSAEFDAVNAIFGWDDDVQTAIHQSEWQEAQPLIIEINGTRVGSYLFIEQDEYFDFGRFFLLPKYQGMGIGSEILKRVVSQAEAALKPINLCYLQGNRVAGLYEKFGFKRVEENAHFVFMSRSTTQMGVSPPLS